MPDSPVPPASTDRSRGATDHGDADAVRSAGHSGALSRRGTQVAQLVAEGLTNREIGARLFVSPNTVKTQAISIYRKLGVSARSDAVQAARDLRLLEP